MYTFENQSIPEGGNVALLENNQKSSPAKKAFQDGASPARADMANHFLTLQRAVGNQEVQRLVAAEQGRELTQGEHPALVVQPKCSCGGTCEKCRSQQHSDEPALMPEIVQRKSLGKPLDKSVKTLMESRFGEDFEDVRIHTDAEARDTAQHLNADAFTMQKDIFFAAGKYDPTSYRGKRLLAHELTHVVQQTRGLRPAHATVSVGQPGDRYEQEADRIADQVASPNLSASEGKGNGPKDGTQVRVQEKWRGPSVLVSRAASPAEAAKEASPKAAGLNPTQIACVKRAFEKAMAMSKSDKVKRCVVTAQSGSCSLPDLQSMPAVKKTLNEAIAPADWDLYLGDPKGLTCRAQAGQPPETCCDEVPALQPKEKPKDPVATTPK
jgi:hypothetical protein